MPKPLGQSGKGIRAWDVVRGGGALLGHGESRRRRCSDLGRGLQAYPTSVTGSGDIADAHRGVGWRGRPSRGVVVVGRRRRTAELERGAAAGRLWPSDPLGLTLGGAAEMLRGQGTLRGRRR